MSDLEAYRAVHARLSDLVRPDDGPRRVQSCPGWTVSDVLAHLTGLCEDWVDQRLDGYASDAWTAAQVARYATWPVSDVLQRWEELLAEFARLGSIEPLGDPARWALGDATTHEADIREAMHTAQLPAEAVAAVLKGAVARWRSTLADANAPTLLLRIAGSRDWWLGTPDDPSAVVAEVSAYEILRALTGRRSRDEVRGWRWSGDPEPLLAAGLAYPFRWPDVV